uniref:(northern house mosquito) hypothetical protein n=1 Tax=Culex pipiens TaxID=7175 RepID=A0A8D8ETR8_CULPI
MNSKINAMMTRSILSFLRHIFRDDNIHAIVRECQLCDLMTLRSLVHTDGICLKNINERIVVRNESNVNYVFFSHCPASSTTARRARCSSRTSSSLSGTPSSATS